MRFTFLVASIGCLFAVAIHGQQRKPRVISEPSHFERAESFLDHNENDRLIYTSGLMDGFYASALFGASDETVATLQSCTKDMDNKQLSAIFSKYVKDHPEQWHLAMSTQAYNALNSACPGVLKVIDAR